ncbi:GNAT family N-acetyltransferase [Allokutzneria sp. A3M-2-11 16]|uniref:GNAT family N-acetyltransferase n=1 Tax=Allokutzneria sp. A3M-2-11 16 TaxID=2962043 RepID=UPI0020B6FAE6|nr:GNAT family N-acetyltransferase [Allokutzneria sp. A3M-2-11 16]MCP3805189.1 GNAT family N-acetyltransferase [Allokutzneria sp. A3M-2-11 16]
MSWTMRALDLGDDRTAEAVHRIGLLAYRVEADLIGFDGIPALHETLAEMRAEPLRWLGAVTPDGEPVAFLAWQRTPEGEVDIDRLCVDPAWFRKGLASALVDEVLREDGPVVVSTGAANTPAITLYERKGFARTGTISPAPGLDLATFRLDRA